MTLSASSKTVRPERPDLELRILRYLQKYPEGLSSKLMRAWIESCRRGGGYTYAEADETLKSLRDRGVVACTNGIYWLRRK